MRSLGKHLVVELYGCDKKLLSDVNFIQNIMLESAKASNTTVIDSIFHSFKPFGVSGVIVIAESHLAIHTWPEHQFAALDFFTCGDDSDPMKGLKIVKDKLKTKNFTVIKMERGVLPK